MHSNAFGMYFAETHHRQPDSIKRRQRKRRPNSHASRLIPVARRLLHYSLNTPIQTRYVDSKVELPRRRLPGTSPPM